MSIMKKPLTEITSRAYVKGHQRSLQFKVTTLGTTKGAGDPAPRKI